MILKSETDAGERFEEESSEHREQGQNMEHILLNRIRVVIIMIYRLSLVALLRRCVLLLLLGLGVKLTGRHSCHCSLSCTYDKSSPGKQHPNMYNVQREK